jgi:hypothetical protein
MPPVRASDTRAANNTEESRLELAKSQWEQGLFKTRQDAADAHSVSQVYFYHSNLHAYILGFLFNIV